MKTDDIAASLGCMTLVFMAAMVLLKVVAVPEMAFYWILLPFWGVPLVMSVIAFLMLVIMCGGTLLIGMVLFVQNAIGALKRK